MVAERPADAGNRGLRPHLQQRRHARRRLRQRHALRRRPALPRARRRARSRSRPRPASSPASGSAPWSYRVDMGPPRLGWGDIPLARAGRGHAAGRSAGPMATAPRRSGPPRLVNMGNPHAVFFVPDLARVDAAELGRADRSPSDVPREGQCHLRRDRSRATRSTARVWERGVGLTLACGSAACATLVAASRLGLMERKGTVRLPGGELVIEWRAVGRPRADDRPGRIRGRVRPRRRAVRSRGVVSDGGQPTGRRSAGGRVDAIDCARGVALIGMAAYHLSWDLADFRLVSPICRSRRRCGSCRMSWRARSWRWSACRWRSPIATG